MKFQLLVVFFLLLCAQFLSTLALESKEIEKNPINVNGNSFNKEEGLKRDAFVVSKLSKGKGSNGGQNDHTKNSKAVSSIIKPSTCVSNVGIGFIVVCMMFVFDF